MDTETHAAGIRLFLARAELVDTWMKKVLDDVLIPSARRLELFELRDYVPRFIDSVTETLRANAYGGEVREKAAQFARVHSLERISSDFALEEVRREFYHLEAVLTGHLCAETEACRLFHEALSEARAIAEETFASQSGTRWREPATLATATEDARAPDVVGVRRTAS